MRSRNWCFTINNPTEEDEPSRWDYTYMIYQPERGSNGTRHLQGYVRFASAKSLSAVKRLNARAHWEVRRGTHAQAKEYCSKEVTRAGELFEDGDEPEQGKRSDLDEVKARLQEGATEGEIADEFFGSWCRYHKAFNRYQILRQPRRSWKTEVTVIYGETGVGKSRLAQEKFPEAYWKEKGQWWDGYENHESVIIDEFYGWIPYHQLLRLLDRYPMTVEVKGGAVNFVPKHIILTSNQQPCRWYTYDYPQLERRLDNIVEMTTLCTRIIKGNLNI